VTARKGAGLAGAATPNEAQKVGRHQSLRPPSKHNQAQTARYSVTAGREPLGTVRQLVGGFVAVTTDGTVVGTFQNLREAAAALPASSSTPASATPEPKSLT
jgi:hypothetical protein